MLIWIVGKDGLLGKSMMKNINYPSIGSCRSDVDVLEPLEIEDFYLKHKPSHIVNCTAVVEVDKAENELFKQAEDVNIQGVINLALCAKKYNLKMIHISTDYVFDGTKKTAYTEEDRVNPINHYGKTKLAGEKELLKILVSAVVLRTASVFGPGKYGLVDSLVDLLQSKKECSFVVDQISSPTYVDDIVAATRCLLDKSGVYHFVNAGFCSRFDLLVYIKELLEKYKLSLVCEKITPCTQKDFPRPAIRPVRSVLCTKKIARLLDFPIRPWEEAVARFFVSKWGKL